MKTRILLITVVFTLGIFACGKKKEDATKTVKREVVKPVVVEKDTVPPTPEPEPIVVEKPDNKYFLISASFTNESNALAYKDKLTNEGFDSEMIIRRSGANPDFYKDSNKGFADKEKALNELSYEKNQPGKEDVWLLIKR